MEIPDQLNDVVDKILSNQKIGTQRKIIQDMKIIETTKCWHKVLDECDNSVCLLKKKKFVWFASV